MTALKPSTAGGKIWRWVRRILLFTGILLVFFVLVVVPYGFSYLLTHARSGPRDLQISTTPAAYQVPFQEIQFAAAGAAGDGQVTPTLSGWYLPKQNARGVIIYAHGLFKSRQEILDRAALLWNRGYAGVLFDFRRHGKSNGELSSIGYLERLDVEGAVRFVRGQVDSTLPIIGYGVSMGAVATALAAAETPEIRALILDSSYLSFDETIVHHLNLWFGLPRFPLADTVILFTRLRVGFKSEDFDVRRALQKIGDRPVLFIAGGADTRMPPELAQQLLAASPSAEKSLVVIPNATHGAAFRTAPAEYEKVVLDFLERAAGK